jgi:hypothetical protein
MDFKVSLIEVTSINQIESKWSDKDYLKLLALFEFGDTSGIAVKDIKEFLFLAITDFEPQEAAAMLLHHQLGDELNKGQIEQISNDMLKENVAEHYSDISFHSRLFDINQLLYKAYNGKFPYAQASVIKVKIEPTQNNGNTAIDKTIALKCLAALIDEHTIIKRLYKDQIAGQITFPEANDLLWYLKPLKNDVYEIITSNYWINNNDFILNHQEVNIALETD